MKKKVEEGWRTGFQQAHLDKFTDRLVSYPVSTCRKGWGLSVPPAIVLPLDVPPTELAAAVLTSLNRSNDAWPPPAELDESPASLFKAMGIRSWKDYNPIAVVAIDRKISTGRIRLCPLKREGRNHVPAIPRDISVAPGVSIETLSEKLLKAFVPSEATYRPLRSNRKG